MLKATTLSCAAQRQTSQSCRGLGAAPWERGEVLMTCMAVVVWPWNLASLQCRDGAQWVFTDQAGIACTKREGGCVSKSVVLALLLT